MKRIALYLTLLFLPLFFPRLTAQLPWQAESPKRELRAVWVTTLSGLDWPRTKATSPAGIERQKEELRTLLDQLKAARINTVLLQTRIRGSVIYPSSIEPWDVCLTGQFDRNPGYDPLQFAIEETHRRGMELHAWIVTIPAFKTEAARKMGRRSLLTTHPSLLHKHNDQYYLDPGLPGTADYLSSLVREVVSRYDIDGIHFDYIRYPENAKTFPDDKTFRTHGKGKAKPTWRRENITHIVRRLYREVKAVKPWVVMSCSPVGKYRDTRRYSSRGWNSFDAVYQDAQGWLREGIQDALFPMMYFTGDHFYPFAVDWQEGSYGRYVAPGLGIYFLHPQEKDWSLSVITRELHYLRRNGLSGQAFFRSKFLTDNTKGLYDYLQQTFYPHPALPPAYPWLDPTPPSTPEGFTETPIDDQLTELRWHPSTDRAAGSQAKASPNVRYNVYASYDYPVDITKGENLIATALSEPRYIYNRRYPEHYGLNLAVTAMDRCGNESEPAQLGKERQTTAQHTGERPNPRPLPGEEHYMPHDGRTLSLPDLETEFYLITDITGQYVTSGPYRRQVDITRLRPGVYTVRTLQKRGISRRIGDFKI